MNTKLILDKLARRVPLFKEFPKLHHVRIQGTESEYGIPIDSVSQTGTKIYIDDSLLPCVFKNGGEAYIDGSHLEYCTPEVGDPASLVAYHEAGKRLCLRFRRFEEDELWCNTCDWEDNTFGAHESYFTNTPPVSRMALVPFLVARILIDGSGHYRSERRFTLSQRARHINCVRNHETQSNRAIICTRGIDMCNEEIVIESLSRVAGWNRLHLICGDAHMCETAFFLKTAMTSLVIELLELGAMPKIIYSDVDILTDLHRLDAMFGGWDMQGIVAGPKSAIELLSLYVDRIESEFAGRDDVTDTVIVIMRDTLEKLAIDPMLLVGRLDWVTKRFLLDTYGTSDSGTSDNMFRSLDLSYHSLLPEKSLYSYLKSTGQMERIVSDELIERAMYQPPTNTRAYIRGLAVHALERARSNCFVVPRIWSFLRIAPRGEIMKAKVTQRLAEVVYNHDICSPWATYGNLLPGILDLIDSL